MTPRSLYTQFHLTEITYAKGCIIFFFAKHGKGNGGMPIWDFNGRSLAYFKENAYLACYGDHLASPGQSPGNHESRDSRLLA